MPKGATVPMAAHRSMVYRVTRARDQRKEGRGSEASRRSPIGGYLPLEI